MSSCWQPAIKIMLAPAAVRVTNPDATKHPKTAAVRERKVVAVSNDTESRARVTATDALSTIDATSQGKDRFLRKGQAILLQWPSPTFTVTPC